MKNLILCFFISFYCIGILSASTQSDSIILALEDTLQVQADSLDMAKTLYDIGERYRILRTYNRAMENYEKAFRIRIDSLGEEHLDVAQIYYNISQVKTRQGKFKEAFNINQKCYEIRKKILGDNDLIVAESYNSMAAIKLLSGEYKEALSFNENALVIRINKLGKGHIDVASTYNNIGINYYRLGKHEKALEFYQKALEIYKIELGESHIDVARCQGNIGVVYAELYCDYEKALNQYEKALKIFASQLGESSPAVARAYINIALCYHELGDYDISLKYNKKAKWIWASQLGESHVNVATPYNNMAKDYHLLRNYDKALEYYNRAQTIREIHLGKNSVDVAATKHNIAEIYRSLGNNKEALKLNREVIQIQMEKLGLNHPLLADTYNSLGNVYKSSDSLYNALKWYDKAMLIIKDNFGENHPKMAENHSNKALIHDKMNNYEKALTLHQKALGIRIDKLGRNHPMIIESYANIARTYEAVNNHETADSLWHIVIPQSLERLNDTYLFLPDNQRLKYAKTFNEIYDGFYSFAAKHGNGDTKRLAAYLLLNTKSLALDYSISVRKLINNINDKELKNLHNELNTINGNISQAELMKEEEREKKNWDLTALRNQQEDLTQQLLTNKTLREKLYKTPVTWENAQSKLKSDEVMLDFVHFYEESDSTWMYYAMLTRKDMPAPQFIHIPEQEVIDSLLQTNKATGQPYYIEDENLKVLYQKIWKPLEPHLEGVEAVHLSPSGLLHRIDFGVLDRKFLDEDVAYLTDSLEFHYYTTMRDFAKKKKTNWLSSIFSWLGEILNGAKYKNLLLFGDIAYGSEKEKPDTINVVAQVRSGLDSLTFAKEEIYKIDTISGEEGGKSIKITGNDATEDTLRHYVENLPLDIIHFATHGLYVSSDNLELTAMEYRLHKTGNPLQRSAIMLSGANNKWKSEEYISRSDNDGILTAYEVSHLDLSDVKLVVLSACETGLGDIHDTEGVLGLQSAFKLAGVEHIIVSLWKVDDEVTKDLMIAFYKNLLNEKQDAPTALRNAKDEVRQYSKPSDWAGFILIE